MTPSGTRRRFNVAATVLCAGLSVGLMADPADARSKPRVEFSGLGTHHPTGDGSVTIDGTGEGRPFNGTFSAVLVPTDGSLPAPGECEPGTASVRVDGEHHRYLVVDTDTGLGSICGQWTDSVHRVTQVFTGRYVAVDARKRRLEGTDGWYEIRLADNDVAGLTIVDT